MEPLPVLAVFALVSTMDASIVRKQNISKPPILLLTVFVQPPSCREEAWTEGAVTSHWALAEAGITEDGL